MLSIANIYIFLHNEIMSSMKLEPLPYGTLILFLPSVACSVEVDAQHNVL